MSDTSKPGQQGEKAAAAKAERITAADNRETAAKQAVLEQTTPAPAVPTPEDAETTTTRRKRGKRDPMKADKYEILFSGVGPHQRGAVVTREELGADDRSLGNLLAVKAVKARWNADDEDEGEDDEG